MDYQKTLNLPKTGFSMKAGLVQKEPQILADWQKKNLYQSIRQKSEGKPSFILHDGPPYANGNIHIGHALNKVLKDIVVKYKTMRGFDSLYIPGWDCHGLPIEHALLKEMKAKKSDVECLDLRQKAHDYAMKYVGIQKEQFKRLGVFGQWEEPYLTLTPLYESYILRSLAELTKKGFIYRRLKPVNWCFDCETALAEAEVEYEQHTSSTVFVKFLTENADVLGFSKDKKVSLLIWTTTPWTLLANVAVAASPVFDYVCVDINEEILIVEKTLSQQVFARLPQGQVWRIVKEIKGQDLSAVTYQHPFGKKKHCPVVMVDYVTKEDGTGLVHTAPGHGQEDYQTGLKYGLDILMPVNDRGVFTEQGSPFEGQHVLKANDAIVEYLKTHQLLFWDEKIQHSYPHCWRCKKPIIFRATYQWFLRIDHQGLRDQIKKTIEQEVQWFPAMGEGRIKAMVETRPDWCLSRQRYWGVPIPAVRFKGKEGQFLYPEMIEHVAKLVEKEGTNIWFERPLSDLMPKGFKPADGSIEDMEKCFDILDVWFDSGVSHRAVFQGMMKRPLPADLYLEGSDQHRGWFQSSMIPSVALDGKAPYRQVLTHGFVVDGEGRKMSKSVGNVIAPDDIIKNNGVDILRLWVASSNYHDDIRLSKEITERLVDSYRKIRNTVRYLLANIDGFDPLKDMVDVGQMLPIDRLALSRYARMVGNVEQAYEQYEFAQAVKEVYLFCNEQMSGFYLDILKDRLYTSGTKSLKRRSAQTVLYHIVDGISRILAPVLCFTADEMFSFLPGVQQGESVHLHSWPVINKTWVDETIEKHYEALLAIRPFVLKALEEKRIQGLIGASLEACVVFKTSSDREWAYLQNLKEELPGLLIVSEVDIQKVDVVPSGLDSFFVKTNIDIKKAVGEKCPRCWNYKTDIGSDADYQDVCKRCAKAIKGLDVNDQ